MKKVDLEISVKAGMVYAALKALLQSVGLDNSIFFTSLIKYFSLIYAFFDLMEEELGYFVLFLKPYEETIIKKISNFFHKKQDVDIINHKINLLCNKGGETIEIELQKNVFNKICKEFQDQKEEHLLSTHEDSLKVLCWIIGENDICADQLL